MFSWLVANWIAAGNCVIIASPLTLRPSSVKKSLSSEIVNSKFDKNRADTNDMFLSVIVGWEIRSRAPNVSRITLLHSALLTRPGGFACPHNNANASVIAGLIDIVSNGDASASSMPLNGVIISG